MDDHRPRRSPAALAAARSSAALGFALLAHCAPGLAQQDFEYIVRPGDNPWNITTRYLKNINYWPRIQDYNQILRPTEIAPGTRLRIPQAWLLGEAVAARVIDVRGTVEHEGRSGTVMLVPGASLAAGSLIRTYGNSSLTLQFPDGSHGLVGENAELRVHQLQRLKAADAQQVHIELRRGQIENTVEPTRRSGGRYVIETPAAIAAARGTEFRVSAQPGATTAETLRGEVSLRNRRGETRLPAATGAHATADGAPGRAVALLSAPVLDALPELIDRLPFRLPIPPLAGAQHYRTRISAPHDLSALESSLLADTAVVLGGADLADGRYAVHVRAIDSHGLEGIEATREIVIDARPEPPFPSEPAPGEAAAGETLRFRWATVADAQTYHFQLAGDSSFDTLLVERGQFAATTLTLDDDLPGGDYFWRIAVSTAAEGRGPWSDTQHFRRLPAGPVAGTPELDGDTLHLRWRADASAEHYQVELSSSADFSAPEYAATTSRPEIAFRDLQPGNWHVRIRTQTSDGQAGRWGEPQQIDVPRDHWQALYLLLPLLLAL